MAHPFMAELDAAVFFLRDGEQARHSKVVGLVRDRAQAVLDAIDAGTPMKTHGGGTALYFPPDQATRLKAAAAALRGAA